MPAGIPECAPVGPPPIRGACRARPVPGANPTTGGAADTRRGKAPPHPLLRTHPTRAGRANVPCGGVRSRAAMRARRPHREPPPACPNHTRTYGTRRIRIRALRATFPRICQVWGNAPWRPPPLFLRYLFPYGGMQNPSRVIRAFIRRIVENPGSAAVPAWP